MSAWETVVGLELHARLATRSKLFSGAASRYGAEPNRQACGVDLALPGTLPVVNREALMMAIRFGLAVGGEIAPRCVFARKNYFYPDLPHGYQISQYEEPIVAGGAIDIETEEGARRIELTRAHLEADAGRLLHDAASGESAVDLNRAGTPLLEIVTEPQLRGPAEAAACMRELHAVVVALGICDGNLEQGSFRCDANLSVRPAGAAELGTRTELKNINSFRFVERALRHEQARQIAELEAGGTVVQETRQYDPAADRTRPMRGKEEAEDYRYFPDPDLLPVATAELLAAARAAPLPELPQAKRARYAGEYGLEPQRAAALVREPAWAGYFEDVVAAGAPARQAANWITGELFARAKRDQKGAGDAPAAADLAALLTALDEGTLAREAAKEVLDELWVGADDAQALIAARATTPADDDALEEWVGQALAEHPEELAQYRAGKTKLLGFFVGQVRKLSGGKADPRRASEALRRRLDGGGGE